MEGKTFTSAIVDFPPDARALPHRHGQAFVHAYVLEGTVRSQLEGKPVRTYHQGENWVEPPGAHHVLTENTSPTTRAKLLVVFVSNTGRKAQGRRPGVVARWARSGRHRGAQHPATSPRRTWAGGSGWHCRQVCLAGGGVCSCVRPRLVLTCG
ncbi:cupin domain-containing protein [Streptomyces incarnatus]|uniref:cupin domain-containing protein n=1 Tax=Streptomyces incarnatus TaxID=665007 RepID=UPI000AA976E8|nr:cupin domain-containing protein [Streptomyces incarnatus]